MKVIFLRKLKFFIQQSWLFLVSLFIFGLMIMATNEALKEKILYNQSFYKFNIFAKEVFPDASDFAVGLEYVEVDLGGDEIAGISVIEAVTFSGDTVGWTFICEGYGYADLIQLYLAVDANFEKIMGYSIIYSNETPGFGDQIKQSYFSDQFKNAPAQKLTLTKIADPEKIDSQIVAITGATISSQAIVDIINTFMLQTKQAMQKEGLISNR